MSHKTTARTGKTGKKPSAKKQGVAVTNRKTGETGTALRVTGRQKIGETNYPKGFVLVTVKGKGTRTLAPSVFEREYVEGTKPKGGNVRTSRVPVTIVLRAAPHINSLA